MDCLEAFCANCSVTLQNVLQEPVSRNLHCLKRFCLFSHLHVEILFDSSSTSHVLIYSQLCLSCLSSFSKQNWVVLCTHYSIPFIGFCFQSCLFSWTYLQCTRGNMLTLSGGHTMPNIFTRMSLSHTHTV